MFPETTTRSHLWFAAGCAMIVVEMGAFLSTQSWEPTAMLEVGNGSPALPQIDRELGGVHAVHTQGRDGKYFYIVARQPWFWNADPETRLGLQDPAYRYGRPLYPLLAGLGGTLSPRATFHGLILIQVLCGGLLAVLVAELLRRPWLVCIALANPGVYFSAIFLTSDLLALTTLLAGLLCWQRGRTKYSLLLFALAALAKEYYCLTSLAVAGSLLQQRRWRDAILYGIIPLLPIAAWRLAVLMVLGSGQGAGNFAWPGKGILDMAPHWQGSAQWLGILGVTMVAAAATGIAITTIGWLRWQCVVWVSLALAASDLVWGDPADLFRVVSPLWMLAVWSWAAKPAITTH